MFYYAFKWFHEFTRCFIGGAHRTVVRGRSWAFFSVQSFCFVILGLEHNFLGR